MRLSDSCIKCARKGIQAWMTAFRSLSIFLVIFTLSFSSSSFSESPGSFSRAKTIAKKLFSNKRETLYCSCRFDENNQVDLTSCNMEKALTIERAKRIEWEHIMPAEHFGRNFQCWKEAICERDGKPYRGRKCCEKIDPVFKHLEAELYNLWPSVGVVNQARSNYNYSKFEKKNDLYGCDFTVDKKQQKVEPKDAVKGLVARANLFIAYHYNIPLTDEQRRLFESWNAQFPAKEKEKQWARQVAEIEGYTNPYIQTEGP